MTKKTDGVIQQSEWGRRPNSDEQGPPDIEQVFKKMFGLGGKRSGSQGGKNSPKQGGFGMALLLVIGVLAVIWALSGIFIVQPAERAAILRFGKYVKTVQPGPHWIPRFIDSRYVLNVNEIMTMNLNDTMLTSGENIVDVEFAIQYRISNVEDYLFNVAQPENSLRQIVDSAVRQVIGTSKLDNILTVGRAKIAEEVRQQIMELVNRYKLGLTVVDVAMQPAKAPEQVKDAFDDVIKAREDNQRIQNQAEAYANKVVPVAEGQASRILQHAKAFQRELVLRAEGDVAEFDAILPVYKQAPQVTSERMYMQTMQGVYERSHVAVVDSGKSNNMFYIPLSNSVSNNSTVSRPAVKQDDQSVAPRNTQQSAQSQDQAAAGAAMKHYLRWQEAQGNA